MFNKNIDLLVIGKNYLSLLMGIENALNQKNVLLLDDPLYKLGDDYLNGLNEFEKLFLEEWIYQKSLHDLINLEDYLKPQDNIFILGNKMIRLGRDYWSNLNELMRKLDFNWELKSHLEGAMNLNFQKEFNELMGFYLKDQSNRLVNQNIPADHLYEQFMTTAPQIIKHLYNVIKNGFSPTSPLLRDQYTQAFLFACKGFYQYSTDNILRDPEFFHLFISMLAPYYQIDHEKLIHDLSLIFQQKKGIFKKSAVVDWSFNHQKPWAIELSSYEGIVHPKKVAMFFGKLNDRNFKLDESDKLYRSIMIKAELGHSQDVSINSKFIVCTDKMIGTNNPFWWLKISDQFLFMKCFVDYKKGTKLSFIKNETIDFCNKQIREHFPLLQKQITKTDIYFDNDICMAHTIQKKPGHPKCPKLHFIPKGTPVHPTSDIHYFGPYNKKSTGLISTFIELNNIGLYEVL